MNQYALLCAPWNDYFWLHYPSASPKLCKSKFAKFICTATLSHYTVYRAAPILVHSQLSICIDILSSYWSCLDLLNNLMIDQHLAIAINNGVCMLITGDPAFHQKELTISQLSSSCNQLCSQLYFLVRQQYSLILCIAIVSHTYLFCKHISYIPHSYISLLYLLCVCSYTAS